MHPAREKEVVMRPEDVVIAHGMDVHSSNDEKIGTVSHVWPTVEDTASGISTTGVFQLDHGGVLGIGAQHLYVPYVAVDACVAGERVTLSCSTAECTARYSQPPALLRGGDSSA
jgi:hypothetical protein